MSINQTIEVPILGMDCADCTRHVQHAIAALPGVEAVDVFLASEKAIVRLDPSLVGLPAIRSAVAGAGYSVAETFEEEQASRLRDFSRPIFTLLGIVFGVVLFVIVVGEWLGLFETVTQRVPLPVGAVIVLLAGYPVFKNVIRAALRRQVIAHTLMTMGVLAALAVGQWATAVVVVFFMRVGDYAESFTTERARRAVRDLAALAPQTARLERAGEEVSVPLSEVQPGDIVLVRPGEKVPVDGVVVAGHATLDQSSITGESLPVEAGPGTQVYAASFASLGALKVRAEHIGVDSTFGRVVRLVEQAEASRADVQRIADRFSAYYLPVVAGVAALTFILRRDPLATAAVLVVACSCSFALATPIAMLASVGAGAKRGLMIKGGKYLESLARADVLLIDKTGTLTLGKPKIVDFKLLNADGLDQSTIRSLQSRILVFAASAERYSEHPLAQAVRELAHQGGLSLYEPQEFEAMPGRGVRARINGSLVEVGAQHKEHGRATVTDLQRPQDGNTLIHVAIDGEPAGVLVAADTIRSEVPGALQELRQLGFRRIELLTGDNPAAAATLADSLGIPYRAGLLPEDKIQIVREFQKAGSTVVMIGDGVNDAPALAQADVGIAMGVAGSQIAIEAAHIALMRQDWSLVPQVITIARRTLGVVKMNIVFTAIYNLLGLSLAALGFLPPIFAAAAQSLPDLGILANSSRLLKQKSE